MGEGESEREREREREREKELREVGFSAVLQEWEGEERLLLAKVRSKYGKQTQLR